MDNRHQSEREYIRYHAATSGEHLVAGIHGLAHGIIGGLTSVITSTVEGVKTEGGVSGFISGLGKGLVGTVTKPVAGALDFASETAQAVRDTATLSGPRSTGKAQSGCHRNKSCPCQFHWLPSADVAGFTPCHPVVSSQ
ncbi:intermembrane lipid transfer protein VPS13D-like isoform X2 [Canis lupus dingo]|nr:intermembrane lipid transfer protein VPS13D-like isoform X2 [Canis lupus dingo]